MKKYKLRKLLLKPKNQNGGDFKDQCSAFPPLPSIINYKREEIERIIAIGDIHGDLDLAINCLTVGKVIKKVKTKNENVVELKYKDDTIHYYQWIGEKTVVIQVGDQVDRCRPFKNECYYEDETFKDEASDVKILFFFHNLHLVALKKKCAVYSLLGNHELLNVLGNLRYVSYKGLVEFQEKDEKDIFDGRLKAFKLDSKKLMYNNETNLSTFLACSRQSTMIINKYLFVHAGVLDKLITNTIDMATNDKKIEKIESIKIINEKIRLWLLNSIKKEDEEYINKLLSGNDSPFWPRVFGSLKTNLSIYDESCKKDVKPVLDALDLKGIVVGHTPQIKININSTCSDTVWRIDVASSQAFENVMYPNSNDLDENKQIKQGRKPQVLEIILGENGEKDQFNILIHE